MLMAAAKALILRWSQARVTSMRILLLAVTIILLGGCAVMGEQDCLNASWHAVGHQDGSVGQGRDRYSSGARPANNTASLSTATPITKAE